MSPWFAPTTRKMSVPASALHPNTKIARVQLDARFCSRTCACRIKRSISLARNNQQGDASVVVQLGDSAGEYTAKKMGRLSI